MASIESVALEIVENEGAAAALVTYRLIGSLQDDQQRRVYIERVQLIGVDEFPGEDGRNDVIAEARIGNSVVFPLATPDQRRLLALPAARLDEDRPNGRLDPTAERDEVRARVTLRRAFAATVVAESDTLDLHEMIIKSAPV